MSKAMFFEAAFVPGYVPTNVTPPLEKVAAKISSRVGEFFEQAKKAAAEDPSLRHCQMIIVTPDGGVAYQKHAYESEIPDNSLCALLYASKIAQYHPKLLSIDRLYTVAVDLLDEHLASSVTWIVYAWMLDGNLPGLYDGLPLQELQEIRLGLRRAGHELPHPERFSKCLTTQAKIALTTSCGREAHG